MRLFALIVLMLGVASFSAGCEKTPTIDDSQRVSLAPSDSSGNVAVMTVHGMGCPQCAYNVDLQLLKVPGVESVKVDLGNGKVVAQLSPTNPPTREQLARAIENTGFTLVNLEMP